MKKISLFIFIFLLQSATFSQSGWVRQNSGTNLILYDVQFLNSNTGFVAGATADTTQGVFLKTIDGGNTWISQSMSIGVSNIFFIDANTGFMGSRKANFILRTSNGGANWVQQPIPQGFPISSCANDIHFLNANTGFIATTNAMYSTSNGGTNWNLASSINQPYFHYLYFVNASTGFVMGVSSFKTTNAGLNWSAVHPLGFTTAMTKLSESNYMALTYFSCGFMISVDSGVTWGEDPFFVPGAEDDSTLKSIVSFAAADVMAVGGNGAIFRARNDLVNNWVRQNSGVGSTLHKVVFTNENTGWIVGANGVILKTTTGGTVGFTQMSTEVPEKYFLNQNFPNPFNPSTKISFSIPKNSFVSLKVFDIKGIEIVQLINENLKAGSYDSNFDGMNLSGGVYFYQIRTNEFSETKKMILVK